jgi:lysophospholipase L1-like esterase
MALKEIGEYWQFSSTRAGGHTLFRAEGDTRSHRLTPQASSRLPGFAVALGLWRDMMTPTSSLIFLAILWFQCGLSGEFAILAFGDSNTWGWIPGGGGARYADNERWAGVLEEELGDGYKVVCDGLVARRTDIDGFTAGPVDGSFLNGAKTLPAAIARNAPVDLVLLFLGTNDVQAGAERTAVQVAEAVLVLSELVKTSENLLYSSYKAPEVWVVVPPPLGDLSESSLRELFAVGEDESHQFSQAFAMISWQPGVTVFDANDLLSGEIGSDGIHLNLKGHELLGKGLARAILAAGW